MDNLEELFNNRILRTNDILFSLNDIERYEENYKSKELEGYNPIYPLPNNEMAYRCNAEKNLEILEDRIKNKLGNDMFILIKKFSGIDKKTLKLLQKPTSDLNKYFEKIL